MPLKVLRFVDLLLVTLTLALTVCHVMEIPGKLRLAGPEWLAVQHNLYIAFGPPLGAGIEVLAIAFTWWLAFRVRKRRPAFGWTLAAAACVTAGLADWFLLVAPMNAVLSGWTPETLPADWTAVRNRLETGHAIQAALFLLAFGALVAALLAETPNDATP